MVTSGVGIAALAATAARVIILLMFIVCFLSGLRNCGNENHFAASGAGIASPRMQKQRGAAT